MGFKIGDEVVCIQSGTSPSNTTKKGEEYTVESIGGKRGWSLFLVNTFNGKRTGEGWWGHKPSRFRKKVAKKGRISVSSMLVEEYRKLEITEERESIPAPIIFY